MATEPFEIEINTPTNASLRFRPASRIVRGRFDARREGPGVGDAQKKWPDPIDAQRIGFDFESGTGYIVEPLQESRFNHVRKRLENGGLAIAQPRESFDKVSAADWLYWMKRAVESGIATVVRGKVPEDIPGTPRIDYLKKTEKRQAQALAEALDRQTAAIERQAQAFEQLTKALAGKK